MRGQKKENTALSVAYVFSSVACIGQPCYHEYIHLLFFVNDFLYISHRLNDHHMRPPLDV
jgi:hypothetical protein